MKKPKFKHCEAVVFDPDWNWERYASKHPLKRRELVFFLGDIPNVQGHCLVIKRNGKVVSMTHPEDLRKATEEEL